jgi:hypothetical protein
MGDYALPPVGRAESRPLVRAICPDCAHRTKLTTIAWPVILRTLRAENPDFTLLIHYSLARSEMGYHGLRGRFAAPDAVWNSDAT